MVSLLTLDAIEGLKKIPDKMIDMCVTSPPYYNLRNYGVAGQIGMEKTPEEYILRLVEGFREVRRVLRDDGTLWVNIGDSYFPHNGSRGNKQSLGGDNLRGRDNEYQPSNKIYSEMNIKQKDLIGIPWMLAFALRADGWYLRQDIIWKKPNPMPESVKDRCTKSHEHIFMLTKKSKYYYNQDSIREPLSKQRSLQAGTKVSPCNNVDKRKAVIEHDLQRGSGGHFADGHNWYMNPLGKNKRDVWTVSASKGNNAHFATFPHELIRPCILAGSRKGGIVLDPFVGSGVTAQVSVQENRKCIGIDINSEYISLAAKVFSRSLVVGIEELLLVCGSDNE